MKLYNKTL